LFLVLGILNNDLQHPSSLPDDLQHPSSPSDDLVMSGDEHEKMLSTPEKQLYCWKSSSDAIQDGVVKGSVCRRFKPVDFFHSPPGAPTGIAANAAAAVTSAAAAAALKRPGPTSTTPTPAQHSAVVHGKSSSVAGVLPASTEQNGGFKHQTAQTLWLHNARGARDAGGVEKCHLAEDCDLDPSSRKAENEPVCEPVCEPSGMQMNRCPKHESCSDAQSSNLGFSHAESSQEAVALSSPRDIEAGPEESEYEQKRKERIKKNKELMEKLGISNSLQRAVTAVQVPAKLHTIFSPPVCLTPTTSH